MHAGASACKRRGAQLTGPMPLMLWAAAAIECAIGNLADMAILLAIQVRGVAA